MEDKEFETIKHQIKSLISNISEIPPEQINEDKDFFKDLGIDSMKGLEIIASIEKKYKIIIPEEQIPKLTNLNAIYDFIEEYIKNKENNK